MKDGCAGNPCRGEPERQKEPYRTQTETDWRELQGDRAFLGGSGSRAWETGKRGGGNGGPARPGTRPLVAGEKVRTVGSYGQKFGWDGPWTRQQECRPGKIREDLRRSAAIRRSRRAVGRR